MIIGKTRNGETVGTWKTYNAFYGWLMCTIHGTATDTRCNVYSENAIRKCVFDIGAFTLKQLVKDIERNSFNGVLTLRARFGKYETRTIIIDER